MLFRILKLNSQFLSLPFQQRETDAGYQEGKRVISNLCVVNDAAEPGVKLCYDFLHTAKKEKNLQNILQLVEKHRNRVPNIGKRQQD